MESRADPFSAQATATPSTGGHEPTPPLASASVGDADDSAAPSPQDTAAAAAEITTSAANTVATKEQAPSDAVEPTLEMDLPPPPPPSSSPPSLPPSIATEPLSIKKTGRPTHPLWAHFHRGDKRNRYHYHAFCRYCVARYGSEQVAATRGVSIDMLRHLEKCTNCPRDVVETVKMECIRRDTERADRLQQGKTGKLQQPQQEEVKDAANDCSASSAGMKADADKVPALSGGRGGGEDSRALRVGDMAVQDVATPATLQGVTQQQQLHLQRALQQHMLDTAATQNHGEVGASRGTIRSAELMTDSRTERARMGGKPGGGEADSDNGGMRECDAGAGGSGQEMASSGQSAVLSPPARGCKRLRADSYAFTHESVGGDADIALANEHKVALLKLAVAAGLPSDCFENPDFQRVLQFVDSRNRPSGSTSPSASVGSLLSASPNSTETFTNVLEPSFVRASADRLAKLQLDRVKEGMLNSTIKGGLTLSVQCWTTLDCQQLVAFNLVNSNGDSACVHVSDMLAGGGERPVHTSSPFPTTTASPSSSAGSYTSEQLAQTMEAVLQALQQDNISVMGIVGDSIIALNAARRVCFTMASRRRSLLVVPCFSRLLSVLAGAVLTHSAFENVLSDVIEVSAYFMNAKLLQALRIASGNTNASLVLPNRENWFSFVACVARVLQYRHAIVKLCNQHQNQSPALIPRALVELVFRLEATDWHQVTQLERFLAPLQETYRLFFQTWRTHQDDPSKPPRSVLEDDVTTAHGLTLAHVMYQLARMTQLYMALGTSPTNGIYSSEQDALAHEMVLHLDAVWRRYELPVMLLALVFNFHLDTTLLDMNQPTTTWSAIAQYFQLYYQRWFQEGSLSTAIAVGDDSTPKPPSILRTSITHAASSSNMHDKINEDHHAISEPQIHAPVTHERVREILDAFKLHQFPFDAETTSDYVDVSSFYSFVSDSHPEICALCCRMYAVSLLTANTSRLVRGIGFVPSMARTTREPEAVELLLHVGFASSLRRRRPSTVSNDNAVATAHTDGTEHQDGYRMDPLGAMHDSMQLDCTPDAVLWSQDAWHTFAPEWRAFLTSELNMHEFDELTQQCAALDTDSALLVTKVPVRDLFREPLPVMARVESRADTKTTATVSVSVGGATGSMAEARAAMSNGVLSVGI